MYSLRNREIEFRATPDGCLERLVRRPGGKEYAHRCTKAVFEAVVGCIDDHNTKPVTARAIVDVIDVPMSQVNVVLQLLTEYGLLEQDRRRGFVAAGYATAFYEHAMALFCGLIVGVPPEWVDADGQGGAGRDVTGGEA